MTTIIKLQVGKDIPTDEEPQALADQFDSARQNGTLLKVDDDDGDAVWINPHMLVTIMEREPYAGPAFEVMS